jgi:hypothetical protein
MQRILSALIFIWPIIGPLINIWPILGSLIIPTLRYEPIHGRTTWQPDLTTFMQPRHIPTRGCNITQSSAPDDGHMDARNMLSNY